MDQRSLLERVVDRINTALMLIAGVALVILIVIMGWLVYGRYILNSTPTWVEQVSLLIIVVITFFGAAVGIRENTHLSVEFFRDVLPERGRHALFMLSDLLLAVFGGLMGYYGAKLSIFNLDTKIPLLGISEFWRSLPLALGGALIMLFSITHMINRVFGLREAGRPSSADNLGAE